MRERDPSIAVAITVVLFFLMCLHARAGDGDRAVIHRTAPAYPELAKQMHVGGAVLLLVSVDSEGDVTDVSVQSGHPLLTEAAISAVRQWKFVSSYQASMVTVSVNFQAR